MFYSTLFYKMSKRSAEEIISTLNPNKTAKRYDDRWKQFCDYCKLDFRKPNEEDLIQFFDHLKNNLKMAASTIWSIYSMLNHKMQLLHGVKLQTYPRITMLLKSYEAGYTRKTAGQFSKEQFEEFIKNAPNTGKYIHIKAGVILAFFGGLRCAELVSIENTDFEFNESTGMWVSYTVSKQRGESIQNKFNVPLEYCQYLENFDKVLTEANLGEGRIFKTYRIRKSGEGYYVNQAMGKHILAKFPVVMASFLNLSNPSSYTGHSLRRSTANVLAEAGASSAIMKKHFNWKSENTCLKYVDNTKSAKLGISNMIQSAPSSSSMCISKFEQTPILPIEKKAISLENCHNIVINL